MRKVLVNCSLLDGIKDDVQSNSYIIIEDQNIVDVGTGIPNVGPNDEVINLDGKFVLPGLIDCHVHLVWDGSDDPQSEIHHLDEAEVTLLAYRNAKDTLELGITTVRDVASPGKSVIHLRNYINKGVLPGPTIVASGRAICMTGGHVHYLGREADGADEVRKATRELMKEGADLIKVMATGGIYTFGEEPGSAQLTVDELRAAVEEARKKNKKVAAHAEGLDGIRNCLEVGIDTIEHGIFADEASLIQMREQGTYLVPTMIVMKRLAVDEKIPGWALEKAKEVVGPHQWMLENAIQLGVKIATGTDCGSPVTPPKYYFDELLIMEDAGMKAIDVIHASTRIAAECIGLEDRGVIASGKKADLIVVDKNPLANLAVLKEKKQVMKNGEFVFGTVKQSNPKVETFS
ncbi:amidohydrolase family protein [Sporosarcina saromensis]|uniref:Amidohydrolase family protein n=1 Tax=Sporosarcina saromensis TaxID=359365 RepID=A0ABU4G800_9BACL|nr:amidohydrolase family protein [Sporosarcina saromensis]MDW0113099.1 amidohydrolase family protein [Sporosarcina saromensis]